MSGRDTTIPILPVFPEVRCDRCGNHYVVDTERSLLVRGNCPNCAHERFSTSMKLGDVETVAEWVMRHESPFRQ